MQRREKAEGFRRLEEEFLNRHTYAPPGGLYGRAARKVMACLSTLVAQVPSGHSLPGKRPSPDGFQLFLRSLAVPEPATKKLPARDK